MFFIRQKIDDYYGKDLNREYESLILRSSLRFKILYECRHSSNLSLDENLIVRQVLVFYSTGCGKLSSHYTHSMNLWSTNLSKRLQHSCNTIFLKSFSSINSIYNSKITYTQLWKTNSSTPMEIIFQLVVESYKTSKEKRPLSYWDTSKTLRCIFTT